MLSNKGQDDLRAAEQYQMNSCVNQKQNDLNESNDDPNINN